MPVFLCPIKLKPYPIPALIKLHFWGLVMVLYQSKTTQLGQ